MNNHKRIDDQTSRQHLVFLELQKAVEYIASIHLIVRLMNIAVVFLKSVWLSIFTAELEIIIPIFHRAFIRQPFYKIQLRKP